ncbi:cytochrome c [Defluviimonas aestuarii]|uniref:c-type cytochrome n=1 Tax=Albidovulum aestuarii TaxID=1130726 RepID=UPI00249B1790|nr:cytochrome c [Defluviimonas aestuarii]MDI3338778.1 cytochrome c [Defluviimonas aestuarii]
MSRVAEIVSVITALGLTAGIAAAQDAEIGKTLYDDYCAACHGAGAQGDGDMANLMTIPAPNLTLLANNNDGEFPMLQVLHIIDGRTGVRAHGGAMPVFGKVFASSEMGPANPYGSVLEVRGRVLSLAMYLESLQK